MSHPVYPQYLGYVPDPPVAEASLAWLLSCEPLVQAAPAAPEEEDEPEDEDVEDEWWRDASVAPVGIADQPTRREG